MQIDNKKKKLKKSTTKLAIGTNFKIYQKCKN